MRRLHNRMLRHLQQPSTEGLPLVTNLSLEGGRLHSAKILHNLPNNGNSCYFGAKNDQPRSELNASIVIATECEHGFSRDGSCVQLQSHDSFGIAILHTQHRSRPYYSMHFDKTASKAKP